MSHNLNYEWRGMEPVSWNNDLDGWQIVEEKKTLHDWSKAPDWAEYAYRDSISNEVIWSRGTWKLQPGHKPTWMKDVEKRPEECERVTANADDALSTQESDPYGVSAKSPGAKLDAGKAPIRQGVIEYFPRALIEVARVSEFGADKYTWGGWGPVKDGITRYGNAADRHALNAIIEGPIDADSGLLHAAHEAWNALARLELILRANESGAYANEQVTRRSNDFCEDGG